MTYVRNGQGHDFALLFLKFSPVTQYISGKYFDALLPLSWNNLSRVWMEFHFSLISLIDTSTKCKTNFNARITCFFHFRCLVNNITVKINEETTENNKSPVKLFQDEEKKLKIQPYFYLMCGKQGKSVQMRKTQENWSLITS